VARYSPTSDVTTIDLTNLALKIDKFAMIYISLSNNTSSQSNYRIYLNQDYTQTNYNGVRWLTDGSTTSVNTYNDPIFDTLPANAGGQAIIFLTYPSGYEVRMTILTSHQISGGDELTFRTIRWFNYGSTINDIRIESSVAGGIYQNSFIEVWGVYE